MSLAIHANCGKRIAELEIELKQRSDMLEKHWAERDPAILRDAEKIAALECEVSKMRDCLSHYSSANYEGEWNDVDGGKYARKVLEDLNNGK